MRVQYAVNRNNKITNMGALIKTRRNQEDLGIGAHTSALAAISFETCFNDHLKFRCVRYGRGKLILVKRVPLIFIFPDFRRF